MASLTKIMTAHCVLNLIENFNGDHKSPYGDLSCLVKILKPVSLLIGTTANLLAGDSISIKNLLYGMMLPSGNDASQALGIYFGQLILNKGLSDPNHEIVLCPISV